MSLEAVSGFEDIEPSVCHPEPAASQFSTSWSIGSPDFENINSKTEISSIHCDQNEITKQDLDNMHFLNAFKANENYENHVTMVSELLGSSCSSSPQSQSDSQMIDLEASALIEVQSNDNTLESLIQNAEQATSSDSSNINVWTEVTSSTDIFLPENSELPQSQGLLKKDCKENALRYPPCAVCAGKSSGLHYGCYTCEACKNFFRRYLLRSIGFICKKNNNCLIANKSRGNCSGCRLKKCLEVGMSKDKSKIGRYTHSQRTETIREVNKLDGKLYMDEVKVKSENDRESAQVENSTCSLNETDDSTSMSVSSGSEVEALTEAEGELLKQLTESLDAIEHFGERGKTAEGRKQIIEEHYDRYLTKVKLIGPLKAIPKDEYFTLLKLYNIDLDGRWSLFKQEANNCAHIVERYCKFAYKIPGFQALSVKDQESLLKVGHCEFFIILLHEGYDHERQIFLEMNGVPAHVEEASDKIFSRKLIEMQTDLYHRWQKACLLKEERTLLCAMSLLCSDRVELENPASVEKGHTDLTELLMKVLRINYGKKAQRRFSKFIDILTFCRQASDAYYKEYQEMSQFDMVQEVAPAFPTLCPDKF